MMLRKVKIVAAGLAIGVIAILATVAPSSASAESRSPVTTSLPSRVMAPEPSVPCPGCIHGCCA